MLIMNGSGDMMNFHLHESFFYYQLRLEGKVVNKVQSFQGCLVSADDAHLCILDTEAQLGYYRWQGIKWQPVRTWQQASPFFQSAVDPLGRFHLVIPAPAGSHYYVYAEQKGQESSLDFLAPDASLLQLYSVDEENLFLLQKESSKSTCHIAYYNYHSASDSWSEKIPAAHLPADCHDLQFFFAQGRLYITYLTPNHNNSLLHLLSTDSGSGETIDHCLGKLSTAAGLPVMSRLDGDLVLLVLEPNNLLYWRSGDQGQNWTTKGELPCPWPLKLAPVLNPQKEITDYIALEGFYGLALSQPGLLTTRELLALSPYGLWI